MKFIGAAALATRQRRERRHGPFDRFASWFNRGFLELRRIDWQSPAAVLEKLIAYEAVRSLAGECRRRCHTHHDHDRDQRSHVNPYFTRRFFRSAIRRDKINN